MFLRLLFAVFLTVLAPLTTHAAEQTDKSHRRVPFTITSETTVITHPRTSEGLVDYASVLNRQARVPAEMNAAALFFEAFGPRSDQYVLEAAFFRLIGIPRPEDQGKYLLPYERYLREIEGLSENDQRYAKCLDDHALAMKAPWRSDDYPTVAAWLAINDGPLTLIVEGTSRSKYFSPIVLSVREAGTSPALCKAWLPSVQLCRSAARGLTSRALLQAGRGNHEQAWKELLFVHRLGHLIGEGPMLVDGLVGIWIQEVAVRAMTVLVGHAFPGDLMTNWRRDVTVLSPPPNMSQKMDRADRFSLLDAMQRVASRKMPIVELQVPEYDSNETWLLLASLQRESLNWDTAMVIGNRWYDRVVEAMRIEDPQHRHSTLEKIDAQLERSAKDVVARLRDSDDRRRGVSELMGHLLTSEMLPVTAAQAARDRIEQRTRNLQLALALAAYRTDEGEYPATLAAVIPRYLKRVGYDIFAGKPLRYKRTTEGYVLYSIGNNRRDDGGKTSDDAPDADDLVVHMRH